MINPIYKQFFFAILEIKNSYIGFKNKIFKIIKFKKYFNFYTKLQTTYDTNNHNIAFIRITFIPKYWKKCYIIILNNTS